MFIFGLSNFGIGDGAMICRPLTLTDNRKWWSPRRTGDVLIQANLHQAIFGEAVHFSGFPSSRGSSLRSGSGIGTW